MKFSKIYKNCDADIELIRSKTVGIIGFGSQGRAQALNLKDSGINVLIGLRHGSATISKVEKLGLKSLDIKSVVENCDILSILVPDQVMEDVYKVFIEAYLRPGQTLLFSHGYNVYYKLINPPVFVSTLLVAPSGSGTELRRCYIANKSIPGVFAVENDYDGMAESMALAYSRGIGLTGCGVVKTTFKEETETDLFGEQAVLTGGIPMIIQSSFKVLIEHGYTPEVAWLVCYYELKTIVDLFHENGFEFMNKCISDTAEYGGMTRGRRIINDSVKSEMENILDEIRSGEFHEEWMKEHKNGYPVLSKLRKEEKNLILEKLGKYMLKKIFNK